MTQYFTCALQTWRPPTRRFPAHLHYAAEILLRKKIQPVAMHQVHMCAFSNINGLILKIWSHINKLIICFSMCLFELPAFLLINEYEPQSCSLRSLCGCNGSLQMTTRIESHKFQLYAIQCSCTSVASSPSGNLHS